MWANRRGDLTAAPFPAAALTQGADSLAGRLDPAALGLAFAPAREEALRSVARAPDLGGLFLGMSLFLLASALVLAGLLFAFGVERRGGETGTLLALGFGPASVAALHLAEAALVAAAGSAAGVAAGTWYAGALLGRLQGSWSEAVAGLEIHAHAEMWTAPAGAAGAFLAALLAAAVALRRQFRTSARELLAGADADGAAVAAARGPSRLPSAAAATAAAAAAVLLGRAAAAEADPAVPFFAAGTLLLLAALLAARSVLGRLDRPLAGALTDARLCSRSLARRPGRSLAVFSLLAAGGFIVFAVAAMRADADGAAGRSSGGGGFALVGESSLPLRAGAAEEALRRAGSGPQGVAVLALKVREGDDASCLNLNRAGAPPLVGVDPQAFRERGAFVPPRGGKDVWGLLSLQLPSGVVPGLVGDGDTARWNLRARTGPADGDEIEYRDERGGSFRVRLVGALPVRKSVFQGTILVPVGEFARRFPAEDGFRMLLLDAPPPVAGAVRDALERELGRLGLELRTPAERLAEFYAVEHAYQAMFLALGGLGLLLGTVGLAVVVLRNVLERRAELALFVSLGLPRARIALLLWAEHVALFAAGIGAGMLAAIVAVLPALRAPGSVVPAADLAELALALFAAGAACILFAGALGARGAIIPALRRE
jgi:hypothetical protein